MNEDDLAELLAAQTQINPMEDLDKLSYLHISLMQNNKRVPSPGLLQAIIKVFDKPASGDLKSVPFDDEEKALFIEAHESLSRNLLTASTPAAEYKEPRGIPVSPDAKKLRSEFLGMFRDKSGVEMSMSEIVDYSTKYSTSGALNSNDLANYMGAGRTAYVSMSEDKIKSLRTTLGVIFLEIGGNEDKVGVLEDRFDRLTTIYNLARAEQRQQVGARGVANGSPPNNNELG